MFKKFVTILTCLVLVFSLGACSSKSNELDVVALNNQIYDETGYFVDLNTSDYVKLGNMDLIEIKQSELDNAIKAQLENYPEHKIVTDRAVVNGDVVNIDYVGYFGDEPFDGGSTEKQGTYVEVGVTQYIDDFIEQLIGHKPGETIDIVVTFPEDYSMQPAYSGKEAKFVTTINHIVEYYDAEWNDAFVEKHFKDTLMISTTAEAEHIMLNDAVFNELFQRAEFIQDVPEKLISWQQELAVEHYRSVAESNGLSLKDYLSLTELGTEEKLRDSMVEASTFRAKYYIFCQALSEYFGYKVSDEEIDKYVADLQAIGVDMTKEQLIETYGINYVRAIITYDHLEKTAADQLTVKIIADETVE